MESTRPMNGLFDGMYTSYVVLIVVLYVVVKFALHEIQPGRPDKDAAAKRSREIDTTVVYPYGVAEMQGKRPYMEDRYVASGTLNGKADASFYGVFDGHGGDGASEYCAEMLCANVTQDPMYTQYPKEALTKGFLRTDEDYTQLANRRNRDDGTTAVTVLAQGNTLYVANVGDSRAILVKKDGEAVALSTDHKPNRPDERERVTNMGGHVIFWGVWRVEGILAVSRAIGDRMLKPYVIAEPEITQHERTADDAFLVLASDGVWDVLSNAEVARLVLQADSIHLAAKTVMEYAYQRGSLDNICAMVIDLQAAAATSKSAPASPAPATGGLTEVSQEADITDDETDVGADGIVTAPLD
ncbi:protein phosphatase 2C [Achlya hypogyna]|uniref:Protein phosphatase 2C n=1 Tax=Achlya hypogyna TaxID=1202772 RepID=A0A1V9YQT7_ACHHY|nr:protein phosphatase 2C [Achlya hypogyna]